MITLYNISKSFGEKQIFKDFSYNFGNGITCITGESGKGKTTLLHIISGEIIPDRGEVIRDCGKLRMAFQEPRLLNWCTAIENVCIKCDDREHGMKLLKKLSLENDANAYPDEMSGGMCQRVSIARALCDYPDVLLLDEPFNGLDPAMIDNVIEVIREYMTGKTVIIVLHNREIVNRIADNIIEL